MAQINKPTDYFNTILYTGNNTTHNITGVGFQPDAIWLKPRNAADHHRFLNSVSGASFHLSPNQDTAEGSNGTNFASFDSDGFTLGGSDNGWNSSSNNYVAWNWLGANASSSNTDGSITSSVSANTTSGFSIVSYTGNSTSGATVGHGLGAIPNVIIVKTLSTGNWNMYHSSLGATKYMLLSTTAAETTASTRWNDTAPDSSVFTLGNAADVNTGSNYIAYCFAEKKGFSKFGSYTGNGNASNNAFVYTGFKPAFVLVKRTNGTGNWWLGDNKRNDVVGGNDIQKVLFPNLSNAEATDSAGYFDFFSNGFRVLSSSSELGGSGDSYIYMAFAEHPLVGTNNIPATAR